MTHDTITHSAPAKSATMLRVNEAQQRILQSITPVSGTEQIALSNAVGRSLARDIQSSRDVPPHDNSAMDGYAICFDEVGTQKFLIVGRALAGESFPRPLQAGEAVRIMTGASLPANTNAVVMQENTRIDNDFVICMEPIVEGDNIRRAGEDIARDQVVCARGERLNPAKIGVLASIGISTVEVIRRPRVAIFSTGNELVEPGAPISLHQIYDSNRPMLKAFLAERDIDVIDYGILKDNATDIQNTLDAAASQADLVITTAGVSVGEADFVKQALERSGTLNFWKIAMKPGKPLTFGKIGDCIFFGLPGNPVSTSVTYTLFVSPALDKLCGAQPNTLFKFPVPTTTTLKKAPGRQDFQRGILESNEIGQWSVRSTGPQGSHQLTSMARANCLIDLPLESGDVNVGTLVEVIPLSP